MIINDAELKSLNDEILDNYREISVDTEFVRFRNGGVKLCLLQIAYGAEMALVDPLACDIRNIQDVFQRRDIIKIFHASKQDLSVLQEYDFHVNNVFDTQIAEYVLCSSGAVGYQHLVSKYLNVQISKVEKTSNWLHRPLRQKQLEYAYHDVQYMHEIYLSQLRRAAELERTDILCEIMRYLNDPYLSMVDELSYRERKALEHLITLQEAMHCNESLSREEILSMIVRREHFFSHLRKADDEKREFYCAAQKICDGLPSLMPAKGLAGLIKVLVEICAEKHDLYLPWLISTRDLALIAAGDYEMRCFDSWRYEVFGKYVADFIAGKCSLRMKDKKIEICGV